MSEYIGLPGVSSATVTGVCVRSPAAAVRALRSHRACSGAGDDGAITAWIGDDGRFRAALQRYQLTVADTVVPTKIALRTWLDAWWPAIDDCTHAPTYGAAK